MKKEQREEKKRREDQALNRVLWWFGGAVILEFFLLFLNRFYINFDVNGASLAHALAVTLRVMVWVSLAAAVGFGVWWQVRRKRGGKTFLPGALTMAATALLFCTAISSLWRTVGVQFLYLSVPAAAVLALIYYLYQRDFFLVALQGAIALFAMWSYRKLIFLHAQSAYVVLALCAVLALALAGFTFFLQRNGGRFGKHKLLNRKANYILLYASAAVTVCAVLAALIWGAAVAYATLFLVVAWLFGTAVYYTVRLM